MKIVALLTGKGNSALKNKNITKVKKKPILAYPCIEAKKVKSINAFSCLTLIYVAFLIFLNKELNFANYYYCGRSATANQACQF